MVTQPVTIGRIYTQQLQELRRDYRGTRPLTLGITGSREATMIPHYELVVKAIGESIRYGSFVRFVHGGCIGIDDVGGQAAHSLGLLVHAMLINEWRKSPYTADWWNYSDTNAVMSWGTSYRERDQAVVDESNALLAFPLYPEKHARSHRSGTWMTIRMARRKGIPIEVICLNQ